MRETLPPEAEKRLEIPLALTRAGMVLEAGLRAFWPFMTIMLFAGAALLSGLVAWLPPRWGMGLLAGFGAAGLVALLTGTRHFRWPGRAEAAARLDARLDGQPISALADAQAVGAADPASRAVWEAHRARMLARLQGVHPVAPRPNLAPRDPYGLRLMALLAFVMALGFGEAFRAGHPADLLPQGGGGGDGVSASWEGWIEPPAYTGKPSLYLADQPRGQLAVPRGSRITLRFYGRLGDIAYSQTLSETPPPEAEAGARFTVDHDGTLTISGPGGGSWHVLALADLPPVIAAKGDMTRSLAGDLEQGFTASDDYGIVSGQATLRLDLEAVPRRHGLAPAPGPRAPITIDLPMPYRGDRTMIEEVLSGNFAQHPWAGLPVILTLSVTDGADQQGRAAPMALILPGRRFLDPLAMALIEQRRDLLWSRTNAARAARLLRAISNRPDGFFKREVTYLMLRTLARSLEAETPLSTETRDQVASELWNIAVGLDETNLSDALERLRQARERLAEAMRQGASPKELSELMDELRQAMRDYTRQLAQQAPPPGDTAGIDQPDRGDQQGQEITQQDLDAMMDAIEEAMREGRQDEAMAMLEQLQNLMEHMRAAEARPGEGGPQGGQAMQGLADSLTQQQGLSDEAFQNLQEPTAPSGPPDESGRGKGRGADEGARDLARRQRELADQLQAQRRNLPGAGSEAGDAAREALKGAEQAMRDAARGLEQGDLSDALDDQASAMEALREGMRQLDRAQAKAGQGQPGVGGQPGSAQPPDPLGRGRNNRGGLTGDAPYQEGEDVYRRAEELTRELRRRAGETNRPKSERDYLRRLLDRF